MREVCHCDASKFWKHFLCTVMMEITKTTKTTQTATNKEVSAGLGEILSCTRVRRPPVALHVSRYTCRGRIPLNPGVFSGVAAVSR